jgi:uncharacterized protein (DUF2267 family)
VALTIEADAAFVVVPLRALVDGGGDRYVAWEAVHSVLRTYRKHIDMNEVERAIVERLSDDLYSLFDTDARSVVDLLAAVAEY